MSNANSARDATSEAPKGAPSGAPDEPAGAPHGSIGHRHPVEPALPGTGRAAAPIGPRRIPRRIGLLVLAVGIVGGALVGTGWHFLTLTPPVPASDIVEK